MVTAGGFEPRLQKALAALLELTPSMPGIGSAGCIGSGQNGPPAIEQQQRLGPEGFLLARCQQLLGAYPTTWQQDAVWLAEEGPNASANMRMAVQFCMGKKAVLRAAMDWLGG